jgi:hypothetical protein
MKFCTNAGSQRALRRHKDHKEKSIVNFVVLRGLRDLYFCTNIGMECWAMTTSVLHT